MNKAYEVVYYRHPNPFDGNGEADKVSSVRAGTFVDQGDVISFVVFDKFGRSRLEHSLWSGNSNVKEHLHGDKYVNQALLKIIETDLQNNIKTGVYKYTVPVRDKEL